MKGVTSVQTMVSVRRLRGPPLRSGIFPILSRSSYCGSFASPKDQASSAGTPVYCRYVLPNVIPKTNIKRGGACFYSCSRAWRLPRVGPTGHNFMLIRG